GGVAHSGGSPPLEGAGGADEAGIAGVIGVGSAAGVVSAAGAASVAGSGKPHSAAADGRGTGGVAADAGGGLRSWGVGIGGAWGGDDTGAGAAGGGGWGSPSRSMTLEISAWTADDQCRTSDTKRPIWRPASGRRLGPSTTRATTRMTRISAGPNEVGMLLVYGPTGAGGSRRWWRPDPGHRRPGDAQGRAARSGGRG